jgi:hypothetical protein
MSYRDTGNPPLFSTTASTTSDPGAGAVVAELILSTNVIKLDGNYEVRFSVGASTGANWFLECALSSAAASTSIRPGPPPSSGLQQFNVFTGSNQTSEFVYTLRAEPGDRFRIRANSSFTGSVGAGIQAERLT